MENNIVKKCSLQVAFQRPNKLFFFQSFSFSSLFPRAGNQHGLWVAFCWPCFVLETWWNGAVAEMGWFWMVGFIDVQTLTQYTQYIQRDMAPHTHGGPGCSSQRPPAMLVLCHSVNRSPCSYQAYIYKARCSRCNDEIWICVYIYMCVCVMHC